jgi:hypothetical protein
MEESASRFAGSYVSITCPDGDIQLDLHPDGSCHIEKRVWDDQQMTHSGRVERSGTWRLDGDRLTLILEDQQLRYVRTEGQEISVGSVSARLSGWDPLGDNPDDVIDRVPLLEKSGTDSCLLSAAPMTQTRKKRWWQFWR